MKEKRYTLTLDLYIYAKDDEDAKGKSLEYIDKIKQIDDNKASICSLHETPFASLYSRPVK